jgi:hypothetical protein
MDFGPMNIHLGLTKVASEISGTRRAYGRHAIMLTMSRVTNYLTLIGGERTQSLSLPVLTLSTLLVVLI